jgi:hypothetical protein
MSNCFSTDSSPHVVARPCAWATAAHFLLGPTSHEALNPLTIATSHAIADTGATSIFIMDGIGAVNRNNFETIGDQPIQLFKVRSTHVCDIAIPGLLTVLTGHIVPDLALASLVGIHPLCKVGCRVIFDKN